MGRSAAGTLRPVEGKPKSPQDQLQEIEKLVTDAARLLDQALFALETVAARLKDEQGESNGDQRSIVLGLEMLFLRR